jgi:hypothetical protein
MSKSEEQREHPGTGARIPGTTESIQSRSVGRDWRTPQPVVLADQNPRNNP